MTRIIETPRISEILWEEFMKPLGISAYQLAKELHVPVSRIQDIYMTDVKSRQTLPSVWADILVFLTNTF